MIHFHFSILQLFGSRNPTIHLTFRASNFTKFLYIFFDAPLNASQLPWNFSNRVRPIKLQGVPTFPQTAHFTFFYHVVAVTSPISCHFFTSSGSSAATFKASVIQRLQFLNLPFERMFFFFFLQRQRQWVKQSLGNTQDDVS